jgi:glycosyltransferase involved in cell wall biosynthesis
MVINAAREIKFDLIFSQHAISAVAAGKLKQRLKIPVVMNFPDLLTGFMETWPRYIAPRAVVSALKRYEQLLPTRYDADGALTVSDALADYFAQTEFPRAKICPIYYGYDARHFPFRTQPSPKNSPIIVMHGSFDAHHLGEIAFNAIRVVAGRRPETIFRFIGKKTASLEKFLARARKEIPGFNCEATGFVPYVEVSKYFADASVGIVPYEESAGTHCAFVAKMVEYIASGLPAVCTSLKSVQSYFKNDPMVKFSAFDGNDFGAKILALLEESPKSRQLDAAKSAARVQAELDWQPLCRKAIDFTEKVLRKDADK